MTKVMGIDGCRAGWFAVLKQDATWLYTLATTLEELLTEHQDSRQIFIDMPIGLADRQKRQCDQLARRMLSPYRHSSVFSTPVRDAVCAADYVTACEINARQTGTRITKQTWNICPKIREVDGYLRQHPDWQSRIYESHPEIAFYALNGQQPLKTRKKSAEGQDQRLALVAEHIDNARNLFTSAMTAYSRKQLQGDDILDAMVLAVMADLAARNEKNRITLPDTAQRDHFNLPMCIVYSTPS